ncbi:uncharacterized protein [Hetaerina americana]|uniref:uncharacterized protein isoform X1 n=1 Tax=Hetaerina americana TaxID=62018 RepID=UPI003A7F19C1
MKFAGMRNGAAFCVVSLLLMLLAAGPGPTSAAPSFVTYLRDTVFGDPLILRKQAHHFDPEAGAEWRKEFVRLNGPQGVKLIERQGKGEGAGPDVNRQHLRSQ